MSFCVSIRGYGTCDVCAAAYSPSSHRVLAELSLYYECLPHTPSRCMRAQGERAGGPRCRTTTYDDDALALSMLVFVTACNITRAHADWLAGAC